MPDSKTFYINESDHVFAVFPNMVAQTLNDLGDDDDIKPIPKDEMERMKLLNLTAVLAPRRKHRS